jgi:RNA-directed DNA polymerase
VKKYFHFPENLHGSVPGRSPITLAQQHRGKSVVVKVDIAAFYPSVRGESVEKALRVEFGVSRRVARILACLLTKVGPAGTFLPQGAPTSPTIANIVLLSFDRRIGQVAHRYGIRYDRYSDDLVFSGDRSREVIGIAVSFLRQEGFRLSRRKTRIMGKGSQQSAVGLNLTRKLSPVQTYRDGCEELLRQAPGVGNATDRMVLSRRMQGKLAHAKRCEGSYGERLRKRMARAGLLRPEPDAL